MAHSVLSSAEEEAPGVGGLLDERGVVAEQFADGVVGGGGPNGADHRQLEADDGAGLAQAGEFGEGIVLEGERAEVEFENVHPASI